jgi:hypothetical protein
LLVRIDLLLHPSTAMGIGKGNTLGLQDADVVTGAKLFDQLKPAAVGCRDSS